MYGYIYQYFNVVNLYLGVSVDDFEFYCLYISVDNYVIYDVLFVEDFVMWVQDCIIKGMVELVKVGFVLIIFEFFYYVGLVVDYQVVQQNFGVCYDCGLYVVNWCVGGNCGSGMLDYMCIYGQFFLYLVCDIFGLLVILENLGNVELLEFNYNLLCLLQDVLVSVKVSMVINDGVQSFFFYFYLLLVNFKIIVQGIQGMGYMFVFVDMVWQDQ